MDVRFFGAIVESIDRERVYFMRRYWKIAAVLTVNDYGMSGGDKE